MSNPGPPDPPDPAAHRILPHHSTTRQRGSRPALAVVSGMLMGGGFVVLLLMSTLAPLREAVLRFIPDDSFYYFEIARRLGLGQGSTFDGINPTNGYHPLWLLMLTPFAPVMDASREAGMRLAMFLGVLLLGGSLFFIDSTARRIGCRHAYLAPMFGFSALAFAAIYGMESALAAALLALLLWMLAGNAPSRGIIGGALLGCLAGLLVLSRLDSALYVLAMDGLWAWSLVRTDSRSCRGDRFRALLAALAVQAALVLPYVAFNTLHYGHPLTISALIKAGRHSSFSTEWIRSWLAVYGILSAGLCLVFLVQEGSRSWGGGREGALPNHGTADDRERDVAHRGSVLWSKREPNLALLTAATGTLLMMGMAVAKANFESYNWYFTLPVMCGGLLLPVVLENIRCSAPFADRLVTLAWLGCVVVLALTVRTRIVQDSIFFHHFTKALWLRQNSPVGTVYAEPDCGILGYLSHRSFINVDGLTNSFAFQDAIRDRTLPQWFEGTGLNAMVLRLERVPVDFGDGTFRHPMKMWKGMYGDEPRVQAVLQAWPEVAVGPEYRLWTVLRVEYVPPG